MPSLPRKLTLGVALALCLPPLHAQQEVTLYVDTKTRQIFDGPGDNRVLLGTYQMTGKQTADKASTPIASAEPDKKPAAAASSAPANSLDIRGYVQARYSSILSGDKGIDLWTDRSLGDRNSSANDSFLIRRGRLVFSGNRGDHLAFYVQPDFASAAGTTGNVVQLRDAYADLFVDKQRVHRFRVGQSKVPYGFENLQSSQNRLTLDRADSMNSAVRDERDTGVFYYYTPTIVQKRFKDISDAGLKHSGNYGMFGIGAYSGQGANQRDTNDTLHTVARFTLPLQTRSGQFYEFGVQGYTGRFVPRTGTFSDGTTRNLQGAVVNADDARRGLKDERIGLTAVMYPQPFGLQAEWNWGKTPGLKLAESLNATTRAIRETSLNGGYLQAMYKHDLAKDSALIPFIKWQYFDGASKAENNSPMNRVNDIEAGIEWQINKAIELSGVYHRMNRTDLVSDNQAGETDFGQFDSDALRLQLQFNF